MWVTREALSSLEGVGTHRTMQRRGRQPKGNRHHTCHYLHDNTRIELQKLHITGEAWNPNPPFGRWESHQVTLAGLKCRDSLRSVIYIVSYRTRRHTVKLLSKGGKKRKTNYIYLPFSIQTYFTKLNKIKLNTIVSSVPFLTS